MTLKGKDYVIQTIEQTSIDLLFFKICYEYLRKYPFKWYFFVDEVLLDKNISYFKDSTLIIDIRNLSLNSLEIVFGILKMFLNYKITSRMIPKKEFIIVHFNKSFHIEYINNEQTLKSINLYYYLNKRNIELYYGVILEYQEKKTTCGFLINDKTSWYLLTFDLFKNQRLFEGINLVYLFDKRYSLIPELNIRIYDDEQKYENQINELFNKVKNR